MGSAWPPPGHTSQREHPWLSLPWEAQPHRMRARTHTQGPSVPSLSIPARTTDGTVSPPPPNPTQGPTSCPQAARPPLLTICIHLTSPGTGSPSFPSPLGLWDYSGMKPTLALLNSAEPMSSVKCPLIKGKKREPGLCSIWVLGFYL